MQMRVTEQDPRHAQMNGVHSRLNALRFQRLNRLWHGCSLQVRPELVARPLLMRQSANAMLLISHWTVLLGSRLNRHMVTLWSQGMASCGMAAYLYLRSFMFQESLLMQQDASLIPAQSLLSDHDFSRTAFGMMFRF